LIEQHWILGCGHFDRQYLFVVAGGVHEESRCFLFGGENETVVFKRNNDQLDAFLDALVLVLKRHWAVTHECLLLRDNLSSLVETVALGDIAFMTKVGLYKLLRVTDEDFSLCWRRKVVEKILVEDTVLGSVRAVNKFVVYFPTDWAYVTVLTD